ncbi:MAG: thioredoxin family protein [Opitutales bacterium]
MKKLLIPSGFLLALFFFAANTNQASGAEGSADWMTDYEAAKETAAAEGKPLLLDFTGSDWCIWCIRLKDEVFTREAFTDYAADELVLVELDFPKGKSQPAELEEQNKALAKKYGIRGFPTIVLLSPEGELIEKTGYRKGGPEAYVEHLKELLASD